VVRLVTLRFKGLTAEAHVPL